MVVGLEGELPAVPLPAHAEDVGAVTSPDFIENRVFFVKFRAEGEGERVVFEGGLHGRRLL